MLRCWTSRHKRSGHRLRSQQQKLPENRDEKAFSFLVTSDSHCVDLPCTNAAFYHWHQSVFAEESALVSYDIAYLSIPQLESSTKFVANVCTIYPYHLFGGAFVHAAVQAVPLPKKSRFLYICSTGTAVPVPFRSLLFSPFIFPFYGTAAFCSSLHFFTQTPQSCISKIRSFGGGALKKFALLRQQYRQKQYRSYIFLPRERNGTVIKLRSHFASS